MDNIKKILGVILVLTLSINASACLAQTRPNFAQIRGVSSTAALESQLAYISTAGISFPLDIYIQPGDYSVSSTISVPANVRLTGYNATFTASTNLPAIFKIEASGVRLRGINFAGTGDALVAAADVSRCVWVVGASDFRATDCKFSSANVGVQVTDCKDVSITGNDFNNMLQTDDGFNGYGVLIDGGSENPVVDKNNFYNCVRHAIYFSGPSKGPRATNNYVSGCEADAITATTDAAVTEYLEGLIVTGNELRNFVATSTTFSRQSGISLTNKLKNSIITGNIIVGPRDYGITVEGPATQSIPIETLVSGNNIDDTSTGVRISLSEDTTLNGNIIHNVDIGVQVSGNVSGATNAVSNVLVVNNRFSNIATYAASIYTNIQNITYGKNIYDTTFTAAKLDFLDADIASGVLEVVSTGHSKTFYRPSGSSLTGADMYFGNSTVIETDLGEDAYGIRVIAKCSETITSGTITVAAKINGSTTPPSVVLSAGVESVAGVKYFSINTPNDTDTLGVSVTTSGTLTTAAPATITVSIIPMEY